MSERAQFAGPVADELVARAGLRAAAGDRTFR
jgi:hypothetical protein